MRFYSPFFHEWIVLGRHFRTLSRFFEFSQMPLQTGAGFKELCREIEFTFFDMTVKFEAYMRTFAKLNIFGNFNFFEIFDKNMKWEMR